MDHQRVTRRAFLARTTAAGAGLAAAIGFGLRGASAQQEPEKRNMQTSMTYRMLGDTNLLVSCLSFGCIQLQDDRLAVLDLAVERGVNTVHVNRGYNGGQAIASLGKFLKDKRDKVWVMLKSNSPNIDADLETLQTDHVDILCVHDLNPEQLRDPAIADKFQKLVDAGKTRFLNLTSHSDPQQCMESAVDCGMYTSVLATINPSNLDAFRPTLSKAMDRKVGTFTMKCMQNAGGEGPAQVTRAMLAAGVTSVLKTLSSNEEAEAFLGAVAEEVEIARAGAVTVASAAGCTLCGACTRSCPQNVAIQDLLRNYEYYCVQQGKPAIGREQFAQLPAVRTAAHCGDCGTCERVCPQRLPVRRLIREADRVLLA
ncbi:MAG TPA: aldo/keto reductase [Armatimonadota bacterium]|nr:aldo/keto reductase [Armatimonadota bacterium]